MKITEILFYQAEQLFVEGNYEAAMPIMVDCVMQGNIYAAHYLDYAIKHGIPMGHLSEEQEVYIHTTFPQYYQIIPKDFHSDAWLKTSLVHQKIVTSQAKKKEKFYNELISTASYCTKAYVLLHAFIKSSGNKKLKLPPLQVVDLYYVLSHIEQSEYTELELRAIEAYAVLANKSGAQLERMIARIWGGQAPLNGARLQVTSIHRMRGWTIAGACMGNHNLQLTFAMDEHVKNTEEEKCYWTITAAYNGNLIAQSMAVNICFIGNAYVHKNLILAGIFANKISENLSELGTLQPGTENLMAAALCTKGTLYEHGHGNFEKCDVKALQCYQAAASLKNAMGCFNVAVFWEHGRGGVRQSFRIACDFYEQAVQFGEIDALEKAASLYFSGGSELTQDKHKAGAYFLEYIGKGKILPDESKVSLAILQLTGEAGVPQNQVAAVAILRQFAGPTGDIRAAHCLLLAYLKNTVESLDLNPLSVENLFVQVLPVETSLYSACGIFYLEHPMLPDAKAKAYKVFLRGAELRQADSLYNLGIFHEQGCSELGIDADSSRAYDYYAQAAVLGHPVAMNNQGFLLMTGTGVEPNAVHAKALLEQALHQGAAMAAYNLACWYFRYGSESDHQLMFKYMLQAEVTQDSDVLQELGIYYAHGIGTERNLNKAADYFMLAAAKGSAVSICNLVLLAISRVILQENVLPAEFLDRSLACIQSLVIRQESMAIFLKAILLLMQDSKNREQALELLSLASSLPCVFLNQKILFALEYVAAIEKITPLELLALLSADVNNFQEMRSFLERSMDLLSASAPTPPAAIIEGALEQQQTVQEENVIIDVRLRKILSSIEWFVDPSSRKDINFTEFKDILRQLDFIPGVHVQFRHATGGSGESCKVEYRELSASRCTAICYSFHTMHNSRKGASSEYDPGRAGDMQQTMAAIRKLVFKF